MALPDEGTIGLGIHQTTDTSYRQILLNEDSPFVDWLCRGRVGCKEQRHGLGETQIHVLLDHLHTVIEYRGLQLDELNEYLDRWRAIEDLPKDLYPPAGTLRIESFMGENFLSRGSPGEVSVEAVDRLRNPGDG